MLRSFLRVLALTVFTGALGLVATRAMAAEATLAWDPNPEADLAGYRLYYDIDAGPPYTGTFIQEGPSPIDIPLASLADPTLPTFRVSGITGCTHVFFALTAYDTSNNESAFSNQVDATIAARPSTVAASAAVGGIVVSWAPPPPADLAPLDHYALSYDVDPGEPYAGTGAGEGPSPITIAPSSLPDPAAPSFTLTGLPEVPIYTVVRFVCPDGAERVSREVSATPLPAPPIDGGVPDTGEILDAGDLDGAPEADAAPDLDAAPEVDAAPDLDAAAGGDAAPQPDAGVSLDAGPGDAVVANSDAAAAPTSDAAAGEDARPSGGSLTAPANGEPAVGGGCACRASAEPSSAPPSLWALLLLALLRPRRAQRPLH
ncbi:MAG: hypothetical protein IT384_18315 [Deltaproteobacteria bacterium]|nr:hypothetical protein [Deltaproteobacteria bacterium]